MNTSDVESNPFAILSELKFELENENKLTLSENKIQEPEKKVFYDFKVRVWLEKKHRNGKPVSLITGIEFNEDKLKELAKKIKIKMGVGGSLVNLDILIQSQDRDKILKILQEEGFKDVKKAGG
jgi:translation initiation factor 1